MTKNKKPFMEYNRVCNNCQYHFTICCCDVCGKCAPDWNVENGEFKCKDYLPKVEVKNEKANN